MLKFVVTWILVLTGILAVTTLFAKMLSQKSLRRRDGETVSSIPTSFEILRSYLITVGVFSFIPGIFWMLYTLVSGGAAKTMGNPFIILAVGLNILGGVAYIFQTKTLPVTWDSYQMTFLGILFSSTNLGMYIGGMHVSMAMDEMPLDAKVIGMFLCLTIGGLAGIFAGTLLGWKKAWIQKIQETFSELVQSKRSQQTEQDNDAVSIPGKDFYQGWLIGTGVAVFISGSISSAVAYGLVDQFAKGIAILLFGFGMAAASSLFLLPVAGIFGGIIGTALAAGIFQSMKFFNFMTMSAERAKEYKKPVPQYTFSELKAEIMKYQDDPTRIPPELKEEFVRQHNKRVWVQFVLLIPVMFALFAGGVWLLFTIGDLLVSFTQKTPSFIVWEMTFGNSAKVKDLQHTLDGEYVAVGLTEPKGEWGCDVWVQKFDHQGQIIWEQPFDRKQFDIPNAIHPTPDGGYILVGDSSLVNGKQGVEWVWKLNAQGQLEWERFFDGNMTTVHSTLDNGYIVGGDFYSRTIDDFAGWIQKLDHNGRQLWKQQYESTARGINAIFPTPEGNYIVLADQYSKGTRWDTKLIQLDNQGQIVWERTLSGRKDDLLRAIAPMVDSGYIAAGSTNTDTKGWGDGNHDAWVVKFDAQGQVEWERMFEENVLASAAAIQPTEDGGYIMVGTDGGGRVGAAWAAKLDEHGNLLWKQTWNDRTFQGSKYAAYVVQLAPDGGYIIAGEKQGNAWIFKLKREDI